MKRVTCLLMIVICMAMPLGFGASAEETVELKYGTPCSCAGDYTLELTWCELLTDRAIADQWTYYYTDTADSPCQSLLWAPAKGMYTTVALHAMITNESDTPCTFGNRYTIGILYEENGETHRFAGTCFQENPGQVDETDYNIRSLVFAPIEPGETTRIAPLVDVSRSFHDRAIQGDESLRPILELCFDSGTTYTVNLAECMDCFGYREITLPE